MNSSFLTKKVSKEVLDDFRFYAYEKADDYVKHMKRSVDKKKPSALYDRSEVLTKTFQSSTPDNSKIKPSIMPKSSLSSRIKFKINLVNAYHHLSEIKQRPRKKSKESKTNEKKTVKRIFSPNKYNRSIAKLLNCTHRPSGSPDVFITNEFSLERSKERFFQRSESIQRHKKFSKFSPLKEIIKKQRLSPKVATMESTIDNSVLFYENKTTFQFYSSRDKTPKPYHVLSPSHKNKGNK
jgi:hypothetical protein